MKTVGTITLLAAAASLVASAPTPLGIIPYNATAPIITPRSNGTVYLGNIGQDISKRTGSTNDAPGFRFRRDARTGVRAGIFYEGNKNTSPQNGTQPFSKHLKLVNV